MATDGRESRNELPDPEEDFEGFVKAVADDVVGEMEANPEPEYWIAKAAFRVLKAKRGNFPQSITTRFEQTLRERAAQFVRSEKAPPPPDNPWLPGGKHAAIHEALHARHTDKVGEPLDPADILKMADEITQAVDGGYHKAYGTDPHRTTMTAGNAWWRTVADAMRAYASSATTPTTNALECLGEVLRDVGFNDRDVAEVRSRLTSKMAATDSRTDFSTTPKGEKR